MEIMYVLIFVVVVAVASFAIIQYLDKCNHKWDIDYVTTESKLEQLKKVGRDIGAKCPDYLLDKKHITTMTCKSCGKVKRYVEDI